MNTSVPPPLPPVPESRSRFVTVLAWVVMVVSGLSLPIAGLSFLMVLAGSPGTRHSDPLGFLTVVCGPPAFLITGFGLLRRHRWAWLAMLVMLGLMIVSNVGMMLRSSSDTEAFTSPDGVRTTVLSAGGIYWFYALVFVAICAGMTAKLLSPRVRREFHEQGAVSAKLDE